MLTLKFTDASPAANRMPAFVPGSKGYIENGDNRRSMRDNPHKYLLYKPSLSQLMVFLSSGFKELPPGGALLLYISADGCFSTTKHPQDCKRVENLSCGTNGFPFRWLRVRRTCNKCEARRDGGWRRVDPWKGCCESQRSTLFVSWRSLPLYSTTPLHHH